MIFSCSHPRGVTTNTTIPVNFLWDVHRMELYLIFHHCLWEQYLMSSFIQKLPTGSNKKISVMADRGFTIKDQLEPLGVALNIPSFLDGRKQLDAAEVQTTRSIASVRIHVERCIGRIKNFAILRPTLPISMARIANQVVSVCAWLTSCISTCFSATWWRYI